MKKLVFSLSIIGILALIALGRNHQPVFDSATQDVPEYGPAKGTLVIVGGGPTNNTGIMEKFIERGPHEQVGIRDGSP